MEGFTIVDAIVAVVIILSAILAYSRGFVRETLSIVGWIAAAVVAYIFAPQARPLVAQIPALDTFLGDSCELSTIAAFAAIFALALVVAAILTPLFSSAVQRSALSGIDQALGLLFGFARGVLIVVVAFIVYDRAIVEETFAVVDDSKTADVIAQFQDRLDEQVPEDAPGWIVQRYEDLVGSCGTDAGSTPAPVTPAPATDEVPEDPNEN